MIRRAPRSTLFPSRRSSDLGRDRAIEEQAFAAAQPAFQETERSAEGLVVLTLAGEGQEAAQPRLGRPLRSEEHTSELQSRVDLVCRLLLEKKKGLDVSHILF